MAEHRLYLASGGIFIAAGAGLAHAGESLRRHPWAQPAGGAALAVVLLAFAAQTVQRNRIWADPVTLWSESAALAPDHHRPRLLLGEALHDAGRRDEAITQFRTAVRLRPDEAIGYVKLGQSLAEIGQLEDARAQFRQALRLEPANPAALHALSVLTTMEPPARGDADHR
jgi:Flp pilus assembly protein TadD